MNLATKLVSLVSRRTLWAEGHVFAISPERIGVLEGIRASVAIGVMLAAAVIFGRPDFAFGAVAAFWNCLCDPLGSRGSRLRVMAFFSVLGAVVMMLASYCAHWGPVASFVALFVLVVLCGLTRSYNAGFGPAPAQAGLLASLAVIIGITSPREISGALTLAGYFLLGSLWTILLTIFVWPIQAKSTAERTLAAIFSRLEDMARFLQGLDKTGEPDRWLTFDTIYRRGVRVSIERGRETTARMASGRERMGAGIDAAARIFATLIALGAYRRNLPHPFDPQSEKPLVDGIEEMLQSLARHPRQMGPQTQTVEQADALLRQVGGDGGLVARAAAYAAKGVVNFARIGKEAAPGTLPAKTTTTKATMFHLDRLVWRHALRVATAVLLAYLVGNWFAVTFSYWAAIAALVVTQPISANTWLRVLERATGSLIGASIAAILIAQISNPLGMVLVIVPLSILVIALRLVSYGAFVIFLTPMFMLLADFIRPAEGLIAARFVNELIGACVGVGASFLLWPERENDILAATISTAVTANMRFASSVLRHGEAHGAVDLDQMQRDAGLASTRLETARERMLLEGRLGLRRQDYLCDVIVALRSICGMAAVLEITASDRSVEQDKLRADRYDALAASLLKTLATSGEDSAPLVLDEDDDLDRAVWQLSLAVQAYATRSAASA
ncbi:MAG: FUSC family protein [Rhizobiaceae bacterium]|nr:FUSC family protein [Rhizobiaceae bacterium]